MSADQLRRAAALMREDAQLEAILREDDPHFTNEASSYELQWHPAVAVAVAGWLEDEVAKFGYLDADPALSIICEKALAVARAYLGRPL